MSWIQLRNWQDRILKVYELPPLMAHTPYLHEEHCVMSGLFPHLGIMGCITQGCSSNFHIYWRKKCLSVRLLDRRRILLLLLVPLWSRHWRETTRSSMTQVCWRNLLHYKIGLRGLTETWKHMYRVILPNGPRSCFASNTHNRRQSVQNGSTKAWNVYTHLICVEKVAEWSTFPFPPLPLFPWRTF